MFHINRKVYFEYDYKYTPLYPNLIASERWAEHTMIQSNPEAPAVVPTFEVLLKDEFDNSMEKFWAFLLGKEDKFVVYLEPEVMVRLQIQYWKSIFARRPTPEALHFLHTTYVESVRLLAYFKIQGQWDPRNNTWVRANALSELEFLSLEEITEISNELPFSPTIAGMDRRDLGIEYLMMDFFADKTSPYKEELLRRIKVLTWDNWLDELEHLKYEILSGTIDAAKLDPTIDTTVGNVEKQLANSDILAWTVDPMFNEDIEYIRSAYDHKIFVPCWQRLADQWGIPYDDMDELNELINTDQYEQLLMRDVDRDYGCSYTRTRFMNKANQTLATWCYDRVRKGKTADLLKFKLKR